MATKAATKPLFENENGKARRVEKSLSQETYLEQSTGLSGEERKVSRSFPSIFRGQPSEIG